MNQLPFRYEDWIKQTSAGMFSTRSARLKDLDEAIKKYDRAPSPQTLGGLRDALYAYIGDEEARSGTDSWKRGVRNNNRIIESLVNAVFGAASAAVIEQVEAYADWPVPEVHEPIIERPIPPPPPPPPDPVLEKEASKWVVNTTPGLKWTLGSEEVVRGRKWTSVSEEVVPGRKWTLKSEEVVRGKKWTPVTREVVPGHKWQTKQMYGVTRDHYQDVLARLGGMYTDLGIFKGRLNQKLATTLSNFTFCVQAGFNKFKELHRLDAEDLDFNLTIAKGIFSALEALPFPFSMIGKAGGAVAGQLETHKTFGSFVLTVPTPGGFKQACKDKIAGVMSYKVLNVSPKKLKDQDGVIFEFIDYFNQFNGAIDQAWDIQLSSIDDVVKREKLVSTRLGEIKASTVPAEVDRQVEEVKTSIQSLKDEIKKQFRDLEQFQPVAPQGTSIWITVGLIADYAIDGLCGGKDVKTMTIKELGKIRFSSAFAQFLYSEEVGILALKTTTGQSKAFYGRGQIPWDGSANHIIATMLYLDWFKRNHNPLELFAQKVKTAHYRMWSADYIRNLGAAMMAHKATAFETTAQLDAEIQSASKRTVLTGGSIADAFAHGL